MSENIQLSQFLADWLIIKYLLDLTTLRFESSTYMPIHLSGIEKPWAFIDVLVKNKSLSLTLLAGINLIIDFVKSISITKAY